LHLATSAVLLLLLPVPPQEKKPAAFGWDAFNPQAIFNAAERRAAKIQPDLEQYRSVTGIVSVAKVVVLLLSAGVIAGLCSASLCTPLHFGRTVHSGL
jgi:hypothetical protein